MEESEVVRKIIFFFPLSLSLSIVFALEQQRLVSVLFIDLSPLRGEVSQYQQVFLQRNDRASRGVLSPPTTLEAKNIYINCVSNILPMGSHISILLSFQ